MGFPNTYLLDQELTPQQNNRPLRSCKYSHFQNEAKCKNEFHLHEDKKSFHINGFALTLALEQRLEATQKCPVAILLKRRKTCKVCR